METSVSVADWLKRIVDEERKRDLVRLQEDELAARKASLVRRNGRGLVDNIRAVVTTDCESFRSEFPGDLSRAVVVEPAGPNGGFVVRKPAPAAVSLTVTPTPETAGVACHYRFMLANGLPPREDRFEVMFTGEDAETLRMRHHGTGQLFATAEAFSEFLLVPVLTGRPR